MRFWHFLYNLQGNVDFLEELKKINCSLSKIVNEKISKGYDIFYSICLVTDQLGKYLLSSRSIMALNYLGKYHIVKQKIKHKVNSNLVYPLSLSVCVLLLQIYLYHINILEIRFFSFWLIGQVIAISATIILYRYIQSKLMNIIVLVLFKCFLNKHLSFENLVFVLKSMKINITQSDSFDNIFLRVTKYPFIGLNNLVTLINSQFEDINKFTNQSIFFLQIFLFIVIGILIILIIHCASANVMLKLLHLSQ